MRLSNARTIKTEDIKKQSDVDKKLEVILDVLNPFIESVTTALNSHITLSENISGIVKTVTITHDTAIEINPGADVSKVVEVRIINPNAQSVTAWYWAKIGSNISIKASFAAGGTTSASVTLFIGYS